jgi:hypothetical protein
MVGYNTNIALIAFRQNVEALTEFEIICLRESFAPNPGLGKPVESKRNEASKQLRLKDLIP